MSRVFLMSFSRKGHKLWNDRRYARVNTAIPRAIQLLLTDGEPGDTAELSHAEFGFQVATIRVHAGGSIVVKLSQDLG